MQPANRGNAQGPGKVWWPPQPISLVHSTHVLEPFVHPGSSTLELPALRSRTLVARLTSRRLRGTEQDNRAGAVAMSRNQDVHAHMSYTHGG